MNSLAYSRQHLERPKPSGIDVVTNLLHFALVTYMVEPEALRPHIDERFDLDVIEVGGRQRALISVVPFLDADFRFVRFPFYEWSFGQTNYRAYVTDRETGEHGVWFFGTVLDSWTVNIPRYAWKLPWHRAKIAFDCRFDDAAGRFERYQMTATSDWASAELVLHDSGERPTELLGFPDVETGMVILTHPLKGYYYRRDGTVGGYHIWHDRLDVTVGSAERAQFSLLSDLNLVQDGDLSHIHSVLLQKSTEFTIYLPPIRLE